MSDRRWLVLKLDAGHLPWTPPGAWVAFPLLPTNVDRLLALMRACPSRDTARTIASFHREHGDEAQAEVAMLIASAEYFAFNTGPAGLVFIDLLAPGGRHPLTDLERGVLRREERHLPDLEIATPVVVATTHINQSGTCWFRVAARAGPVFETVSFRRIHLT